MRSSRSSRSRSRSRSRPRPRRSSRSRSREKTYRDRRRRSRYSRSRSRSRGDRDRDRDSSTRSSNSSSTTTTPSSPSSPSSSSSSTKKRRNNWDQAPADPSAAVAAALKHGESAIPPTSRNSLPTLMAIQQQQVASMDQTKALALTPEQISQLAMQRVQHNTQLLTQGKLPLDPLAGVQCNPQRMDQIRRTNFIGNVMPEMTEEGLKEFFNHKILKHPNREPSQFPLPVASVTIKRTASYAFMEFFTKEDADLVMCMDGIEYMGKSLKVRRHSSYIPDPNKPSTKYNIPGIISSHVENDANKCFLGPVPLHLKDDEVKRLVTSFGPVAAFSLVKDIKTGESKGYAFFSYVDPSVTDAACTGLSGLQLGGKELTCRRANLPSTNSLNLKAKLIGGTYDMLCPVNVLLETSNPPQPTPILILQNVAPLELLKIDEKNILNEIRSEGERYGPILKLLVHKDRIFIEYETKESAIAGYNGIMGRRFDGRLVMATFLTETDWKNKNLD